MADDNLRNREELLDAGAELVGNRFLKIGTGGGGTFIIRFTKRRCFINTITAMAHLKAQPAETLIAVSCQGFPPNN